MDVASGSQGVAAVEVVKTSNGINQCVLSNSQGASAGVSPVGGQVISWKTHRGEELLFTSHKASINSSVAVRGGISICFPKGSWSDILETGFGLSMIILLRYLPMILMAKPMLTCYSNHPKMN